MVFATQAPIDAIAAESCVSGVADVGDSAQQSHGIHGRRVRHTKVEEGCRRAHKNAVADCVPNLRGWVSVAVSQAWGMYTLIMKH